MEKANAAVQIRSLSLPPELTVVPGKPTFVLSRPCIDWMRPNNLFHSKATHSNVTLIQKHLHRRGVAETQLRTPIPQTRGPGFQSHHHFPFCTPAYAHPRRQPGWFKYLDPCYPHGRPDLGAVDCIFDLTAQPR